jgi:superfamily II DNA or RNA helicase/HKD family nuclease
MSRDKNLIDLIASYQVDKSNKKTDIPRIQDSQWIIDQFVNLIRDKLEAIDDAKDQINFLNQLTNNIYALQDNRIISEVDQNKTDWLSELVTTKIYDGHILKDIYHELETCQEAIIISPFVALKAKYLKGIIERNSNLKKLTIITTTYGVGENIEIDIELLEKIKALNPEKIEIKIEKVTTLNQYQRLHAKAYYFKRENKMSTLYVGSSNFSQTGLSTGLEYSIKVSEFSNPLIITKFLQYKDQLLNSGLYDINDKYFVGEVRMYLNVKKIKQNKIQEIISEYDATAELEDKIDSPLERVQELFNQKHNEINLYDYQSKAIKNLETRFQNGARKQLVVMATGTGKTIVALQYVKQIAIRYGKQFPRVLFVAHREEILEQTKNKFMDLCRYPESDILSLYAGRFERDNLQDKALVIASVQTLYHYTDWLKTQEFDLVIFDEVHHVDESVKTFYKLFQIFENNAKEILGLTATPQRTSGANVVALFDDSYTYELTVYEAVENGWLSPFDYFMLYTDDLIDFDIERDAQKLNKFMNNEKRFEILRNAITDYIDDVSDAACLVFCSSIENAEYMAQSLNASQFVAKSLTSKTTKQERHQIISDFKARKINFLCVIDIFNEGIDIPEINNIIFLRPTFSKLIFLQQLGRGLRLQNGKRLNVIDIVNNINTLKNKKYNPINYLSGLMDKPLSISNVEKNIRVIDEALPDSCYFFISKSDEAQIKKLLSNVMNDNSKNIKNILSSNQDYSYECYVKTIEENFADVVYVYDREISFLPQKTPNASGDVNKWEIKLLGLLSNFNFRNVILEIQQMVKTKQPSQNRLINNLFLGMFYNTKNPYKGNADYDSVLSDALLSLSQNLATEIEYLCQYKLDYTVLKDNILTNNLDSFKGLTLPKQLIPAFFNDRNDGHKIGYTMVMRSANIAMLDGKECVYIWTSEIKNKRNQKGELYNYENRYDVINKELFWTATNEWTIDKKDITKSRVEDSKINKYLFYEFVDELDLKKSVYTFIGVANESEQIVKNNGKLAYIFTLK